MSIRPTRFNADGSIDVWHDEASHGGVILAKHIQFGSQFDGTPNVHSIGLRCPVSGCGSMSVHPVGGGADPEMVQRLFVRQYKASKLVPEAKDWASAVATVTAAIVATDGPERVRIADAKETEGR